MVGAGALVLVVLVGLLAMHALTGGHGTAALSAGDSAVAAEHGTGASAPAAEHGTGASAPAAEPSSLALVSAPASDPAPHCPACPGGDSAVGVAAACVPALLLLTLLLAAPPRWPGLAAVVAPSRVPARAAAVVVHPTVPLRLLLSISRT
ncbi:hypothetical protein [Agromyces sp. NPDC060279]|uniref:hypothetical protein n=1 Tax=Agromyces sp. NPDC060279 TaxID=3347092 RepID=UPI00364B1B6F